MSPRRPDGDHPLTAAERVRKSRWMNKVEQTAVDLEQLLIEPPRGALEGKSKPRIFSTLLSEIAPYIVSNHTDTGNMVDSKIVRAFKMGNGNQIQNRRSAVQFALRYFNAELIDESSISTEDWGVCRVAAFTDLKGAMIAAPNKQPMFGASDWHKNDHFILIRDLGNGECRLYINKIKELFKNISIGKGGVTWDDVEDLSVMSKTVKAQDIVDVHNENEKNTNEYLDSFRRLIGSEGATFGQRNRPEHGICDGADGVQWQLVLHTNSEFVRFGVNLEGIKYSNWPIANLLINEIEDPDFLRVCSSLPESEQINVLWRRDAWQAASRPIIDEQVIGGSTLTCNEVTSEVWELMLNEALDCLDETKDFRARAKKTVTLSGSGVTKEMDMSPHLQIYIDISQSSDIKNDLRIAQERLMPIYEWTIEASKDIHQ
ncbi:MAG: hypothetical protein HOG80_13390 [Candidatus Marinimicrobia bacterium]|nr:hypothetical protein [Candidatus Neomarinimicrobiota bacterium]